VCQLPSLAVQAFSWSFLHREDAFGRDLLPIAKVSYLIQFKFCSGFLAVGDKYGLLTKFCAVKLPGCGFLLPRKTTKDCLCHKFFQFSWFASSALAI
jgi:hypothetical protein